jgi:hypothetical protein
MQAPDTLKMYNFNEYGVLIFQNFCAKLCVFSGSLLPGSRLVGKKGITWPACCLLPFWDTENHRGTEGHREQPIQVLSYKL